MEQEISSCANCLYQSSIFEQFLTEVKKCTDYHLQLESAGDLHGSFVMRCKEIIKLLENVPEGHDHEASENSSSSGRNRSYLEDTSAAARLEIVTKVNELNPMKGPPKKKKTYVNKRFNRQIDYLSEYEMSEEELEDRYHDRSESEDANSSEDGFRNGMTLPSRLLESAKAMDGEEKGTQTAPIMSNKMLLREVEELKDKPIQISKKAATEEVGSRTKISSFDGKVCILKQEPEPDESNNYDSKDSSLNFDIAEKNNYKWGVIAVIKNLVSSISALATGFDAQTQMNIYVLLRLQDPVTSRLRVVTSAKVRCTKTVSPVTFMSVYTHPRPVLNISNAVFVIALRGSYYVDIMMVRDSSIDLYEYELQVCKESEGPLDLVEVTDSNRIFLISKCKGLRKEFVFPER